MSLKLFICIQITPVWTNQRKKEFTCYCFLNILTLVHLTLKYFWFISFPDSSSEDFWLVDERPCDHLMQHIWVWNYFRTFSLILFCKSPLVLWDVLCQSDCTAQVEGRWRSKRTIHRVRSSFSDSEVSWRSFFFMYFIYTLFLYCL